MMKNYWPIRKVDDVDQGGVRAWCRDCGRHWDYVDSEIWDHVETEGHQVRVISERLTIWERAT